MITVADDWKPRSMSFEEYERIRSKFLELEQIEEEEKRKDLEEANRIKNSNDSSGTGSSYNPYKKSKRVDIRQNYYKTVKWCYKCSHLKPNR